MLNFRRCRCRRPAPVAPPGNDETHHALRNLFRRMRRMPLVQRLAHARGAAGVPNQFRDFRRQQFRCRTFLLKQIRRAGFLEGQRIVLLALEDGRRRRIRESVDAGMRSVLDDVHVRSGHRYSLLRHRMFWDATCAPGLGDLAAADAVAECMAECMTDLQDAGRVAEAWAAAGMTLVGRPASWLGSVPVNLRRLPQRVREMLPGADRAALRTHGGAIVLSGLTGRDDEVEVQTVPARGARGLPLVPDAAWMRPVDVDLLRLGLLKPHEAHPLVASALLSEHLGARDPESDELMYRTVPGFHAPCETGPGTGTRAIVVQCGAHQHRVAQLDGRWQTIDHTEHQTRERLLARLGGQPNWCQQAAGYLSAGLHVVNVVEPLLDHGRVDDALRVLRDCAGAAAKAEDFTLPDGGTVGDVLAELRENTLWLRMILSGAPPARHRPENHCPHSRPRLTRKGEPARTHR